MCALRLLYISFGVFSFAATLSATLFARSPSLMLSAMSPFSFAATLLYPSFSFAKASLLSASTAKILVVIELKLVSSHVVFLSVDQNAVCSSVGATTHTHHAPDPVPNPQSPNPDVVVQRGGAGDDWDIRAARRSVAAAVAKHPLSAAASIAAFAAAESASHVGGAVAAAAVLCPCDALAGARARRRAHGAPVRVWTVAAERAYAARPRPACVLFPSQVLVFRFSLIPLFSCAATATGPAAFLPQQLCHAF